MKNSFEKEIAYVLQEEIEIPDVVRKSLDNTYDLIKQNKKKKYNKPIWRRGVAAACCIIIAGAFLTNESVMAIIKPFINFGDKGIERAVDEGFILSNNSSAVDKDISIKLDSYFYDSNKLGLSFKLKFNDTKLLEKEVERISVAYSLKNKNGEYLESFISSKRDLVKGGFGGFIFEKNPVIDSKNGEVQYDTIIESMQGAIPQLENAVVEVESVDIFYKRTYEDEFKLMNDKHKRIDGIWNLQLNNSVKKEFNVVEYEAKNNKSEIEIMSAKASPTSFNLSFALNTIFKNNKLFYIQKIQLADEKGNVYEYHGWNLEEKDGKTIISTNFPVSSYENDPKYKLILSNIEVYEEQSDFKSIMPDVEIELIKK